MRTTLSCLRLLALSLATSALPALAQVEVLPGRGSIEVH